VSAPSPALRLPAPRLELRLDAIEHNTRTLVDRLTPRGIRVTGVTKAALGSPGVGAAMLAGGAVGLGDARLENLARLEHALPRVRRTQIRSPQLSRAAETVRHAHASLNTEQAVLAALSRAALTAATVHDVVLMVELGDLREGIAVDDLLDAAQAVRRLRGLRLVGIGTNLACQSGVVPDLRKMDQLSQLADAVEHGGLLGRIALTVVSGGNSANLGWALGGDPVGRVDELRIGEAILLGTDPLTSQGIPGLRLDAATLVAEVIEVQTKPARPWGDIAQGAFGTPDARPVRGGSFVSQAILAVGRQDVARDGLVPPEGVAVLGMSSDHLVVDLGDRETSVGDELRFGLGYGGLLRAATSPFVTTLELAGG
jgi:predicted amino acid racemase